MMNYDIFKKVVIAELKNYMTDEFHDIKLKIHPVKKVNTSLDGITVISGEHKASPIIYINKLYDEYKRSENIDAVLRSAAECMKNAIKDEAKISQAIDLDNIKDNLVFQLVNTGQNKELLADIPNREFQDLSIIYRWVVKIDGDGIQSTVIHNSLAKQMELTEEELFKLAVDNTRRILPPTVRNMNDVIKDMFMKDGMPPEFAEIPPEKALYVISNELGINGAISMLYEDKLHTLAEDLETDLYIMPSSVHEVIAVSSHLGDPNELAQMVAEINMDQVALEERLSNQVYHYDKNLRKLYLATDNGNKKLTPPFYI